jgi:hypothetical protein
MAGAVLRNPGLLAEFPGLKKPNIFGPYAGIVASVRSNVLPEDINLNRPSKETVVAVRNILMKTAARDLGAALASRIPDDDSALSEPPSAED